MVIMINWLEVCNVVNGVVSIVVGDVLEEVYDNFDVWVVVIIGVGDKLFCVGVDFKVIVCWENLYYLYYGEWGIVGYRYYFIDKLISVVVSGMVLDDGVELVLVSDLVVVDEYI